MRRKKSAFLSGAMMILLGGTTALFLTMVPKSAEAVPSFARQINAPCSTCHTQQPRLNRFGTEFKMNGWQMSNRETINIGDDHTIFESLPVSARFRGNFAARSGDSHDGTEKSLTLPNDIGFDEGNGIVLYVAGKIADGIGIFGDGDVRVNANTRVDSPVGSMLVGVVGGQMRPGAADPFDTVGGGRMMAYTQNRDFVFNAGPENNEPWRRRGKGANVFAAFGDWYVSAGWWGLAADGGNAPSPTLDLEDKSDMQYYRVVYRPTLGATNSHVGFHSSRISVLGMERWGVDAASQIPLGSGFAQMLDVIGVITGGKDEVAGNSESHQGYQISTALLRNKLSYGIQAGYYDRVSGDATNIGLHVSYLIRPNIRVYSELHRDSVDNGTSIDDNFFTIGFDSDW